MLFDTRLPSRFWDKITPEPNSGCWLWLAGCCAGEYGNYWDEVAGVKRSAHRVAYERLVGPVPDGLQLDHVCRVRPCANPDHVEPVTPKENINRGRRANAEKTHCIHGHEFTPENTYQTPNGNRSCRACRRIRYKRSKAKQQTRK